MKFRFCMLVCFFCAMVFVGLGAPTQAQDKSKSKIVSSFSPEQRKEVQEMIGSYLRANPEIILESVRAMQQREQDQEKQQGLQNLVAYRELILNDPTSPVGGNPKGDVTVVEFFDYNCGYCKRVFPTLKKLMAEDKNLRVVFKEFPILSPQSELAARAALAAWRQDKTKYMEIHSLFIELKGGFTESRILRLATKMGLDIKQLKIDMRSSTMNKVINGNRQLAQQLGISGTPGFIIGNRIVPGAVDLATLKALIAEARKG
jgi:protein-disulfide isomerase